MYVRVGMCAREYGYRRRPAEGFRYAAAGVAWDHKPPDMGARNQAQMLSHVPSLYNLNLVDKIGLTYFSYILLFPFVSSKRIRNLNSI